MARWRVWGALLAVAATAGVGAGLLSRAGLGGYLPLRILSALLAGAVFVSVFGSARRLLVLHVTLGAFVLWSALSIIWSADRTESITTLVGVVAVAVLAVVLVVLEHTSDIPRLLMWLLTGTSVISVLVALLFPAIGGVVVDHPTEGTYFQPSGLFIWNSDFGFSAAIAAVLAVGIALRERRWWLLGVAAVNMGAVWYSNSAAALIVLAGSLFVLVLMQSVRIALITLGGTLVAALGAMVVLGVPRFVELVFGAFGRSSTLTGRTALWEMTIQQAMHQPWLGLGAGTTPDLHPISNATHAHNGLIQLFYDRGIVGVVLMLAVIVVTIALAIRNRDAIGTAVIVAVLCASIANSYLTFASFGLLLLVWQGYRQLAVRRYPRQLEAAQGKVDREQPQS